MFKKFECGDKVLTNSNVFGTFIDYEYKEQLNGLIHLGSSNIVISIPLKEISKISWHKLNKNI